jgi:hypothetical protein
MTDQPAEQSELSRRARKRPPHAPVKPGWRRAKATSMHSGGHPAFVPTPSERRFVQAMAGLRMSADEICKVIGSGRNSAQGAENGRPIAKSTLFRHFKNELANARSMLKARVAGKFYAALDNNEPWAIQMAMRNQFNWDAGRGGFDGVPPQLEDAGGGALPVQVTFVVPSRREPPADAPDAPAHGPFPWQRQLPAPEPMLQKDAFGVWRPMGRTE